MGACSAGQVRQQKRGPRAWDNASKAGAAALAAAGVTRLLVHAVADTTWRKYHAAVEAFLVEMQRRKEPLDSARQLDWALARYLDEMCFQDLRGFSAASALYSGVTAAFPEFKGQLPLAARSLIAWQRLDIPGEGGPIPLPAILLITAALIEEGHFAAALATLMAEDGFLRESDWAGITAGDVAVHGDPDSPHVAAVLGQPARGESTKTGSGQGIVFETVLVRLWLAELVQLLPASSRIVPLTPEAYRRLWNATIMAVNLPDVGPPHSLRHSRPSSEVLSGARELEGIRRRGRWLSLKSVQRYTKGHILVKSFADMPPAARLRGTRYALRPASALGAALRRAPPGPRDKLHRRSLETALERLGARSFWDGRSLAERDLVLRFSSEDCFDHDQGADVMDKKYGKVKKKNG